MEGRILFVLGSLAWWIREGSRRDKPSCITCKRTIGGIETKFIFQASPAIQLYQIAYI